MKKLVAAAAVLLLAGCATPQVNQLAKSDKIQVSPKPVKKAPVVQSEPEATTPNQVVKKRWFDRFLKHKSAK